MALVPWTVVVLTGGTGTVYTSSISIVVVFWDYFVFIVTVEIFDCGCVCCWGGGWDIFFWVVADPLEVIPFILVTCPLEVLLLPWSFF